MTCAAISTHAQVIGGCDVLAVVRTPVQTLFKKLRAGQTTIGLLDPLNNLEQMKALADRRVTAVAFELQGATDILAATNEHATA